MANKRSFKREINYICSALFAECVAASLYGGSKIDEANVDSLLMAIMRMHSDYVMRVSHPEPGMAAKKYYAFVIKEFNNEVNGIVDQISNLH